MKVYIGWDSRESEAYQVAAHTLLQTSGITAEPLNADRLASIGLFNRPTYVKNGITYDIPSQAPVSTEFANARFLVPLLCQSRWALFTDCDVVFLDDVNEMLTMDVAGDPGKAVYCVQHPHLDGDSTRKMDNQIQTQYKRKNWSSVMLFDCWHPANSRLSLWDINHRPGRDLHGIYWLSDDEIGHLSQRWNWLVNVRPKPEGLGIAHFTLGGPWMPGWAGEQHDDIWYGASNDYEQRSRAV